MDCEGAEVIGMSRGLLRLWASVERFRVSAFLNPTPDPENLRF